MGDENYLKMLERLSKTSGLEKAEIERMVQAKIAKLSGLISKEGAAQVVAAELGVSFDNERFKINELLPGMKKVQVVGKVIRLFPVRSFERQGKENKVCNFIIADDTSNVKVVLWDTNHIDLIEKGKISEGTVIELVNGSVREGEIHLGSFSELKQSSEKLDNLVVEKQVREKIIKDFNVGDSVKVRAFVVQSFQPRFFNVCIECKKKVTQEGEGFKCAEHGAVACEKRALINFVIDDGTETIRAVAFHEQIGKLGLKNLNDENLLNQEKENLLGKEFWISGNVRKNSYFNNLEFNIDDVFEVNVDELLEKFEKN